MWLVRGIWWRMVEVLIELVTGALVTVPGNRVTEEESGRLKVERVDWSTGKVLSETNLSECSWIKYWTYS